MNSRNEMKVIRDVSCTNSLHYDSELRGVGPNPLDFRNVMEKIRGKTGSFFLKSSPCLLFLSCFLWASDKVQTIEGVTVCLQGKFLLSELKKHRQDIKCH